ncbi:hypothetical protein BH10PSE18_BH10PSE18_18840 [soil metagenome]
MAPRRYDRPRLTWIKRRARQLMHLPDAPRRLAIRDAADDYSHFVRPCGPTLTLIAGGRA